MRSLCFLLFCIFCIKSFAADDFTSSKRLNRVYVDVSIKHKEHLGHKMTILLNLVDQLLDLEPEHKNTLVFLDVKIEQTNPYYGLGHGSFAPNHLQHYRSVRSRNKKGIIIQIF